MHVHRSRYRRARPRRRGSLTPLQIGTATAAGLALAWYAHAAAVPGTGASVAVAAAGAGGAAQMSTVSSNVALGQRMAAAAGWSGPQWSCLDALWTRESGWQTEADNAASGAWGIPQSLPADKMAAAGGDYLTDPATQIRWGLSYIAGRYGTPCGAWAHETSAGWY